MIFFYNTDRRNTLWCTEQIVNLKRNRIKCRLWVKMFGIWTPFAFRPNWGILSSVASVDLRFGATKMDSTVYIGYFMAISYIILICYINYYPYIMFKRFKVFKSTKFLQKQVKFWQNPVLVWTLPFRHPLMTVSYKLWAWSYKSLQWKIQA